MNYKSIFLTILFSTFLLFSFQNSYCSEIDQFLSEIEKNMSNIKSVQTSFVQKKHMSMFDMPITIKGKIYIENPEKFAWMVTEPIIYTLIITDDKVKKWDESNGVQELSLKKNPMFKAMVEQITFWFSGSYASCKNDYDISLLQGKTNKIEFIPKKHNPAIQMLSKIILTFQNDKKYISNIKLVEQNTDITELFFNSVILNEVIHPSVWDIN